MSIGRPPTEWQHIGNQISAAMIFARADFVNVRYRRATAPIKRSHSSKLPRKPSSQAVLKLSRAFISRRFPPFLSLTFR
jgi:hypothetical protein